jgi:hypothetical protein
MRSFTIFVNSLAAEIPGPVRGRAQNSRRSKKQSPVPIKIKTTFLLRLVVAEARQDAYQRGPLVGDLVEKLILKDGLRSYRWARYRQKQSAVP